MHCFKIRHRSDRRVDQVENLKMTYVASVDGRDCFKVSLNREQNRVLQSQFESLTQKFRDFEICQTNAAGLRKISATESSSQNLIGVIHGNKIVSENRTVLIDHITDASESSRIGGGTFSEATEMYSFRKEPDKTEIGVIESPRNFNVRGPMSLVSGIVNALMSKEKIVWEGQMNSLELDLRLILAAAVTLHSS